MKPKKAYTEKTLAGNQKVSKMRAVAVDRFNKIYNPYQPTFVEGENGKQFYCNGHVIVSLDSKVFEDADHANEDWENTCNEIMDMHRHEAPDDEIVNPFTVDELKGIIEGSRKRALAIDPKKGYTYQQESGKYLYVGLSKLKNGGDINIVVDARYLLGIMQIFEDKQGSLKIYATGLNWKSSDGKTESSKRYGGVYFKGYDGEAFLCPVRMMGDNKNVYYGNSGSKDEAA